MAKSQNNISASQHYCLSVRGGEKRGKGRGEGGREGEIKDRERQHPCLSGLLQCIHS